MQRPIVHVARLMEPVVFQIIATEMFEARAHAAALHTLDVRLCHLPCKDGIF